jgi:hypothetical protein
VVIKKESEKALLEKLDVVDGDVLSTKELGNSV